MKPKNIWANFGVASTERTQAFYSSLGFKQNGYATKELVSFLFGENEFVIHFFHRDQLSNSIEGAIADLNEGNEIMFTLSVETMDEFITWIDEVKNTGGKIFFNSLKDRKKFYDENGYYVCVFADPDGHKFNLFYNAN
ncbi:hypothetical protein SAMN04487906_0859 [Zhouia amylolytica]|uniref:Glyoxalase/fosfomycin resistance/dioxygenase domain-containing protein n=1 Tax=Zhouia amylolytica TaxID=376730 RepID=A0A1I6QTL0_9FLAO|nr:VOC family protein [Zhouia amylolytica]SFS55749.1 hypothetical protein SAMN04487906_0859 [Zhouia amylolytica]